MSYVISTGNAYFADRIDTAGVITFDTPVSVDTIKSVGVNTTKAEQTIFASGKIYSHEVRKVSKQYTVDAVSLPRDIVRKYLGKAVSTNKGFAFETDRDVPPEFAFGTVTEYKSGKKVFNWAPRCQLITFDPTVLTATDAAADPTEQYVIMVMPHGDDGTFEVEYDQSQVDAAKVPLTETAFFAAVVDSKDNALIDSETAVTP